MASIHEVCTALAFEKKAYVYRIFFIYSIDPLIDKSISNKRKEFWKLVYCSGSYICVTNGVISVILWVKTVFNWYHLADRRRSICPIAGCMAQHSKDMYVPASGDLLICYYIPLSRVREGYH